MLEQVEHLAEGVSWATIVLGAYAAYMVYRHGIPWVWGKMQSIWGSIKGGSVRLENLISTSVEDMHLRVDELATRVQALEGKPSVVVHVPAAPAPGVHVDPATPASGVSPVKALLAASIAAQASVQQQLLTPAGLPFPTATTQGGAV